MNKPPFNLRFKVTEVSSKTEVGEIDLDISRDGDIEALYLDGHDYSDYGEVIAAVISLIGTSKIQQLCYELDARETT